MRRVCRVLCVRLKPRIKTKPKGSNQSIKKLHNFKQREICSKRGRGLRGATCGKGRPRDPQLNGLGIPCCCSWPDCLRNASLISILFCHKKRSQGRTHTRKGTRLLVICYVTCGGGEGAAGGGGKGRSGQWGEHAKCCKVAKL